ncbi:MAG: GLPGLI family protein [Bacteroidota bacterium]
MKRSIIFFLLLGTLAGKLSAQQVFIEKAAIEFEVKTNIKKTIGDAPWAEMLKESMPQFKTGYFKFTFSNNKSIYKFDHWASGQRAPEFLTKDDENNTWYFDHDADKIYQQKTIFGSEFMIQDSIPKISWRITNENREIAGFNCRKAVGVIMDSVYVFAFYTDEITIPGGPCTINGLPGMILGVTIPRLYTSFIATKVIVNGVKENEVKPAVSKKYSSRTEMKKIVNERMSEAFSGQDDENSKNFKNQFLWSIFL